MVESLRLTMEAKGLLPCPFCGSPAEMRPINHSDPQFKDDWAIGCVNPNCLMRPYKEDFRGAIYAAHEWNRREEISTRPAE